MRRLVVFFIAAVSIACAQDAESWHKIHADDEAKWAMQTGLTPFAVHQLWRLASHFADAADDDSRIELLDTGRLGNNHVLLVTYAGSDYCLAVTVFAYSKGYKKLWAEDTTPEGEGFCGGEAHVGINDGKIVISVPSRPARIEDGRTEINNYNYEWNGKTYRFTGNRKTWRNSN